LHRLSLDEGFGSAVRAMPAPVTISLSGSRRFSRDVLPGTAWRSSPVSRVRAIVGESERIADLFAGLGTFALALGGQNRWSRAIATQRRAHDGQVGADHRAVRSPRPS
jgi:23S rRNA (uracil1939-C5)-methyltransferase